MIQTAPRPLNEINPRLPNVNAAVLKWAQPLSFRVVEKKTVDRELVETLSEPVTGSGTLQPMREEQIAMKMEGQRSWKWWKLHADPMLTLELDTVVERNGVRFRVLGKKDFSEYGYIKYELAEDFTG